MKCPRDNTELVVPEGDPRQIPCCSQCGGMWIERAQFREILARRETAAPQPASALAETVAVGGARHAPVSCPLDHGALMVQKAYRGIQVDICRKHQAFWLDGGEYDKLVEIYRVRRASGVPPTAGLFADLATATALRRAVDEAMRRRVQRVCGRSGKVAGSGAVAEGALALGEFVLAVFLSDL